MMIESRLPADADAEQPRNAVEEGASSPLASDCIFDPSTIAQSPLSLVPMHGRQSLLLNGIRVAQRGASMLRLTRMIDFMFRLLRSIVCSVFAETCSLICSQIVEHNETWLIGVLGKHVPRSDGDISLTFGCSPYLPAEQISSSSSIEMDQDTY